MTPDPLDDILAPLRLVIATLRAENERLHSEIEASQAEHARHSRVMGAKVAGQEEMIADLRQHVAELQQMVNRAHAAE